MDPELCHGLPTVARSGDRATTRDLPAHIAECLERHRLAGTTGVLAVSGGPDSVALAHLCTRLLQEPKIPRIIFAHINHQLRGEESDADEAFIHGLPTLWQLSNPRLTCRTTRIDVATLAAAKHENLESTARQVRYRWLTQIAHEEQAAWIATGHTADDQAETVLFRLLRGSGMLGLGGMSECRPVGLPSPLVGEGMGVRGLVLIRPLLTIRRQALLDYLKEHDIAFRVDSSNRDLRFTRNRLRLELMPKLEQDYNPGIVDVLCNLAGQARKLNEEVVAQATLLLKEGELPRAGPILVFSIDRLTSADVNLVREMFRLVWQREGWPMGEMDFERWQRLVEVVQGTRPAVDCPGQVHVRRVGKVVQLHIGSNRSV